MRPRVICLPGGVAPAAQRYAPLRAAVAEDAELYLKDLEVYRDVLARLFADIHIRRFAGVHDFVASEEIYTPDHVRLLLDHWRRTETSASQLAL